ncbi:hypothetical protein pb186bvf_018000 [Paramecium bursaria]
MFSSQYDDQEDEVHKQKLCINEESDDESKQEIKQVQQQVTNQSYNYPQIQQPYQQQYQYQLQNTQIINQYTQNQQQPNGNSQYQTYVQVVPEITEDIIENPILYHNGQKKVFTLSVVTLWIFQILLELVLLIKLGLSIDIRILYPCFFTALLMLIYTLYENHPINKFSHVSLIDQLLFIIYFLADIFTNFAICSFINSPEFAFFLIIFRFYQFGNLVCSMYTLVKTDKQLQIKEILIITLIPFATLWLFAYGINQLTSQAVLVYLIPVTWQIVQFILTFNLIRVVNDIYGKENKKIDINNIYTGFILFKYSYYIPYRYHITILCQILILIIILKQNHNLQSLQMIIPNEEEQFLNDQETIR